MESELESVCCAEISRVAALVPEGSKCITSHPGFEPICLNIHALQVAYYTLRQDRPAIVDAPDIHTYRYTECRQFVRWVWVRLGQRHREVLPSCVVKEIRNAFPSAQYAGFKYPE
ncbi:P2X purinoceptor 7-like [Haemaphysalis longicornis]